MSDPIVGSDPGRSIEHDEFAISDDAPCGYLACRPSGAIVRVNRTFARWVGFERATLVGGMRIQDLLTMGSRVHAQAHWFPVLSTLGSVAEVQLDVLHRDGRPLPMLLNAVLRAGRWAGAAPAGAEGGEALIHIAILVATDRKKFETEMLFARRKAEEALAAERKAQESLRIAEERFRLAAEAAGQGVFEWDMRTRGAVWENQRMYEIFGRAPADGVISPPEFMSRVLHVDDGATLRAKVVEARRSGRFQAVVRIWRADGALRWVEIFGRIELLEGGQGERLVGVMSDITERKRIDDALAEQNARVRRLIDSNIVGVVLGEGPMILEANDAFLRLVGLDRARLARGLQWSELTPPEWVAVDAIALSELTRLGKARPFEKAYLRPDGSQVPVLLASAMVDSARTSWVAFVVDLTEQKRAEQALKEADRQKDEFLATLAHELRNPLAPIRNSVQLLGALGSTDQAVERAREIIARQVDQLARLVDDLLDVSRITQGRIELRAERIDVADVVRSAVETSRPAVEAGRHALSVHLPAEPLLINGDLMRLAQVLANLLHNAAKYTPGGGHISVDAERDRGDAVIRVSDTGVGIPGEMLPRVFEMFTQVDKHLGRSQGGLGIGLTLARRLVEMHGGSIAALSSGADHGSTFVVRLPLLRGAQPGLGVPGEVVPPPDAAPVRPMRILIVDDNEDSAETLAALLEVSGHTTQVAFDGPTALATVASFLPDVVLLDIGLPGLDGYEVARRMRLMPAIRGVTLVAQTGWGQPEDRRRSSAAGFNHHLVKPLDDRVLGRILASSPVLQPA